MKKLLSLISFAYITTPVLSSTQEYYLIDADLIELGAVRAPTRVTRTTTRTVRPAPVVSRTTFVPTTYHSYSPLVVHPIIPISLPAYHPPPIIQTT
jgi:hypothetical protein